MQANVPSSTEVLALRKLGRSVDTKWVEWAVQMLVEGRDSPSLRVLAGESGPFNQFEMAVLVDRTFDELGLRQFASSADAAVAYASILAQRLLDGITPPDVALQEIAQVCVELHYLKDIFDFYLLRHARDDLQLQGKQYYWPGANRENIDALLKDYCRKWLGDHRPAA